MAKKRPTILQIIPELDTGGAERTTVEMAEAIVKAGGRAIVLSEGGRLSAEVEAAGGEMIHFPAATKNPLRILANARTIAHMIKSEGVDLVHARSRAPAWSAYLAARRTHTPFVTTYHGIYNEKGHAKRAYNSIMAKGDLVIANSAYTARIVLQRYGIDPSRIIVVNRGVDVDRFDRARVTQERIAALCQAWDVTPEHRVILHPARLTRWKGQSVVVDALADLKRSSAIDKIVFVFAGDAQGRDNYVAGLKTKIAAAGLEDHVRLVGHVTDMPAALAASDIVLVASIEPEAFGRTSVEAQAMGKPVIATSIGAPPDTVLAPPHVATAEATGRHVTPADAQALAAAITELLSFGPDERQAMADRARKNARNNYTTRALQYATLQVYDQLLGTGMAQHFTDVTTAPAPPSS